MKVKDLIQLLNNVDPNLEVFIKGAEDGADKANTTETKARSLIKRSDEAATETWFKGEYAFDEPELSRGGFKGEAFRGFYIG